MVIQQNPYYLVIYPDPLKPKTLVINWFNTFDQAWEYVYDVGYADSIYRYDGGKIVDKLVIKPIGLGSTIGPNYRSIREILEELNIPISDEPYEHL